MKIKLIILTAIALATAAMGQDQVQVRINSVQWTNALWKQVRVGQPRWICVTNLTVTRDTNHWMLASNPPIPMTEIREFVDEEVRSNYVFSVWYKGQTNIVVLETTPPIRKSHSQYSIEHRLVEERTLVFSNAIPVFDGLNSPLTNRFRVLTNGLIVK